MPPPISLDILETILDRVHPADLATFCRTSKTLYPHSRNALYRHLHLNPRNVLKACFALCEAQDMATCVKSFVLTGTDVEMSLGVIQDTLLLMPQLRTLVLMIGCYGSWILPQNTPCPFQLKTFKCGFPFEKEVRNFVSGQRELRHISLNPDLVFISPTLNSRMLELFPQLTAIAAPLSVIQEIVPGRPVREVAIYRDATEDHDAMFDCLAYSMAQNGVQKLLTNRKYLHVVGKRLAIVTPNLTHLTVNALYIDPNDSVEVLIPDWMERLITQQRYLGCFTMIFDHRVSTIACQEIDFAPFITKVFEASSSLKYVIVAFQRMLARYTCKRIPGQDWFICDNFEVI